MARHVTGCSCTRFLDAHHIHHWAEGGETSLQNTLLVCRFHHQLLHEGRYQIRTEDGYPTFYDSQGRPVPNAPPPPQLPAHPHRALAAEHARRGITVGPQTLPLWNGDRLDTSWTLETLARRDGLPIERTPVAITEVLVPREEVNHPGFSGDSIV